MLLRVVGWLLMIEALFMILPCLVAFFNKDESVLPFLICIGVTGGSGALMTFLKPKSREMGKREAILLTGSHGSFSRFSACCRLCCTALICR